MFVFLLVSPGVLTGEGEIHIAWCLMDGYDVFVINIYSCDRP